MEIKGFSGVGEYTKGHIQLVLKVGPIVVLTRFHVVDSVVPYHILLGRPWLHKHQLIPFTYHQCVKGRLNEKPIRIAANPMPFDQSESHFVEVALYDKIAPAGEASLAKPVGIPLPKWEEIKDAPETDLRDLLEQKKKRKTEASTSKSQPQCQPLFCISLLHPQQPLNFSFTYSIKSCSHYIDSKRYPQYVDVQHANLDGYGGEELQGDYNVLTQPLIAPYYDIPTSLEERGDDDIQAQDSTHHIPTMEAPSPSFITNTWDNINVPCDHVVTPLYIWSKEMEFRKGLIFSNKTEVKYATKIYNIDRNQRYKVYESNLTQWAINCTNACSWKLQACQRKKHGFWEITKYNGPHTCTNIDVSKDGKMLDSNLIEREILNQVVADHGIKISTLDAQISKQYDVKVSYYKLWDAKQKAIAKIYGDWVQSYEILPKFMLASQEANPTTVVVKFVKKYGFERNTERFQHGKLLIAMAQDANNEIYPLAFAIVENESESTWKWFLCLIRLHVTQREGIYTISDRHGGIKATIMDEHVPDWRSPNGHWRFCLRHVASNFLQRYKDQNLKNMIMRAGSANQKQKFNTTMDCIRRYNEEASKRLDEIAVEQWTYSHDGGHRYGAMTTNLSECFNGVLKGARSLPITALVEDLVVRDPCSAMA
uniref:MULE transposase domain-containing protein n=1 Tax=Fagus sylvatica TaxID=28930 RepID=A0A2N9J030_FAGSY